MDSFFHQIKEARDKLISVGVFTDEEEMIYLA